MSTVDYKPAEDAILKAIKRGIKFDLKTHGPVWDAMAEVTGRIDNPYVWNAIHARLQKLRRSGLIVYSPSTGWSLAGPKVKEGGTSPNPVGGGRDSRGPYREENELESGFATPAPTTQTRRVIHLAAGSDEWEPTPEELTDLIAIFKNSTLDPRGATVATAKPVRVTVHEVTGTEHIVASTGDLSDEDIRACVKAFNIAGMLRQGSAVEAFRRVLAERRSL